MRIVHIYKDYHPPVRGGIEQTVERMARAQADAGHDVTVLVSASGRRRSREERLAGVRVVRVAEWARAFSAPLCPGFPAAVCRERADVWHLHFPNPTGEVSWLLARPAGALVVTYHSDIVRQRFALPAYAPVVRALLGRAQVIMPTSERYLDQATLLRPHRARCRVVPLGIDVAPLLALDAGTPAAAALRRRYGGAFVLFVGRLRYYKGVDVLLRAMRSVEAPLVVVGEGPESGRLRALGAALGLGSRLWFAGSVDDVCLQAHLAAAAVGVLPSTHASEALGIAMIEYLAAGLPAVCTELGTGTTFVNRDGETGFVVPPRDEGALASALARLLADPGLRARMGQAGRRRAQEVFSLDAMMQGVGAAYAEALAGARP